MDRAGSRGWPLSLAARCGRDALLHARLAHHDHLRCAVSTTASCTRRLDPLGTSGARELRELCTRRGTFRDRCGGEFAAFMWGSTSKLMNHSPIRCRCAFGALRRSRPTHGSSSSMLVPFRRATNTRQSSAPVTTSPSGAGLPHRQRRRRNCAGVQGSEVSMATILSTDHS